MITIVLIIHIILSVSLVTVVLLQRSEGGALGIGGSQSSGFLSGRGAASALTRTTAILATAFIATSILLAILASSGNEKRSILENPPINNQIQENDVKKQSKPSIPSSD
ncbi:preprotein translocase subunit SecG [Alphaproteobacteria bacterium]|nr:preprotein translocase subunit SecG [Alphaproteobacteria bacterium]